jgi:hypothetical protein
MAGRDRLGQAMKGSLGHSVAKQRSARRPGSRSSGGCGLARPVVPGGVSLLTVLLSTRSNVEMNSANGAIITANSEKHDGDTVSIPLVTGSLHSTHIFLLLNRHRKPNSLVLRCK